MANAQPHLVPIGVARRMIGVSASTMRRWARQGRMHCWRGPGGRRYFDSAELSAVFHPERPSDSPEVPR